MRMLYIMAGSLALAWGLRILDPSTASAVPAPAAANKTPVLVLPAIPFGRARADIVAPKARRR